MDRGGEPLTAGGFGVVGEGDQPSSVGAASGIDLVSFDPVVDDVGADAECGGDVGDGAFVVAGGCGVIDGWEVDGGGDVLTAGVLDVWAEWDAPLVVVAAAGGEPAAVDPVGERGWADAESSGGFGHGDFALVEQTRRWEVVGVA